VARAPCLPPDEAEFAHQGFDRAGTFLAYASCPASRGEEVEAKLFDVIDHEAKRITEEEVERSRNKIAMDLTLQNERPSGRMMALGAQQLYLGRRQTLEEQIEAIRSVTRDDLAAVVAKYPFTPRTVARLTPRASD